MSEELGKGFVCLFVLAKELRGEGAINLGLHKFALTTMAVSLPRYLFVAWLLSSSLNMPTSQVAARFILKW